jgi:hypothetical protein
MQQQELHHQLLNEPLTIVDQILKENVHKHGFNHDAYKLAQEQIGTLFKTHFQHQLHQVCIVCGSVLRYSHNMHIRFLY